VFRQDRTNPSTKISQWRGRSSTPKAWPSTRVSTWMNGGLFGGAAGIDSWVSISQTIIASTPTYEVNFTSIPQTYQNLRIVISSAELTTYPNMTYTSVNGDTTATNYYLLTFNGSGATTTGTSTVHFGYGTLRLPYGDFPAVSTHSPPFKSSAVYDLVAYVRDGSNPRFPVFGPVQAGNQIAQSATDAGLLTHSSTGHISTTSSSSMLITRETETSNYSWEVGTKVTLYGRGEIP